jgi:hypothetical protein
MRERHRQRERERASERERERELHFLSHAGCIEIKLHRRAGIPSIRRTVHCQFDKAQRPAIIHVGSLTALAKEG